MNNIHECISILMKQRRKADTAISKALKKCLLCFDQTTEILQQDVAVHCDTSAGMEVLQTLHGWELLNNA